MSPFGENMLQQAQYERFAIVVGQLNSTFT